MAKEQKIINNNKSIVNKNINNKKNIDNKIDNKITNDKKGKPKKAGNKKEKRKLSKRHIIWLIGGVCLIGISIGGYFIYKNIKTKNDLKKQQEQAFNNFKNERDKYCKTYKDIPNGKDLFERIRNQNELSDLVGYKICDETKEISSIPNHNKEMLDFFNKYKELNINNTQNLVTEYNNFINQVADQINSNNDSLVYEISKKLLYDNHDFKNHLYMYVNLNDSFINKKKLNEVAEFYNIHNASFVFNNSFVNTNDNNFWK